LLATSAAQLHLLGQPGKEELSEKWSINYSNTLAAWPVTIMVEDSSPIPSGR